MQQSTMAGEKAADLETMVRGAALHIPHRHKGFDGEQLFQPLSEDWPLCDSTA